MKEKDRFKIQFGSLANGEHEFEYEIDGKFFEQFENSLITRAQADVLVTVNKSELMLLVDFTIEGTVTLPCDRCMEDLDLDIVGFNELIVKFGEESGEESEDVIVISTKENELNVAQFIYEYITLMIPIRNVHPDDENGESTCNPEAMRELEKHRIHEEEIKPIDPRWEKLKQINPN
jgi:uncharacterized protein